jgi:hypothetical protein
MKLPENIAHDLWIKEAVWFNSYHCFFMHAHYQE